MASQDPREANKKPPFPKQEQDFPGSEAKMDPLPDFGEKSYKSHNRLQGKIALITGGDSGIGRAVALAYAREGADVAISYYNEHEDAKETERVVLASGKQCLLLPGDIQKEEVCKQIVADTVKKYGRIDILVNNAAFQGKTIESMDELTHDRVCQTFHTNIIAMFDMVRLALPHMKPGGSIINTSSIQSYQPSDFILDYATTKGAITSFSKGLAQHTIKHGIRTNVVAPGPVWTPFIVQSFPPEKSAEFGKNNPMGRPAMPVELSPSYVFLASDEATFINGEILGVTGGLLMG